MAKFVPPFKTLVETNWSTNAFREKALNRPQEEPLGFVERSPGELGPETAGKRKSRLDFGRSLAVMAGLIAWGALEFGNPQLAN